MIRVHAGGHSFDAAAFVFDKDGLLFESIGFWIALAEERLTQIRKLGSQALTMEWARCFGVVTKDGITVETVDANGILALASPAEEISATATLIAQILGTRWTEARDQAGEIFRVADEQLDLRRALRPRRGFPGILERLRQKGVPYGVATSDTAQRVLDSFRMFDDPDALAFILSPKDVARGKPNPDMLEEVSRRLGVSQKELVMIGDSFVDVEMARRAGAVGIGIPETEEMKRQMHQIGAIVLEHLDQIQFE